MTNLDLERVPFRSFLDSGGFLSTIRAYRFYLKFDEYLVLMSSVSKITSSTVLSDPAVVSLAGPCTSTVVFNLPPIGFCSSIITSKPDTSHSLKNDEFLVVLRSFLTTMTMLPVISTTSYGSESHIGINFRFLSQLCKTKSPTSK